MSSSSRSTCVVSAPRWLHQLAQSRVGERGRQRAQCQFQGGQVLAEGVVQLARDAAPLLFLGLRQSMQQFLLHAGRPGERHSAFADAGLERMARKLVALDVGR